MKRKTQHEKENRKKEEENREKEPKAQHIQECNNFRRGEISYAILWLCTHKFLGNLRNQCWNMSLKKLYTADDKTICKFYKSRLSILTIPICTYSSVMSNGVYTRFVACRPCVLGRRNVQAAFGFFIESVQRVIWKAFLYVKKWERLNKIKFK